MVQFVGLVEESEIELVFKPILIGMVEIESAEEPNVIEIGLELKLALIETELVEEQVQQVQLTEQVRLSVFAERVGKVREQVLIESQSIAVELG